MKGYYFEKYCSPQELELRDVEVPVPGEDRMLVKVMAAGVNPLDWHLMRAKPWIARLMGVGLLRPKPRFRVPGADIAGVVQSVGESVTRFKPGDEVFGDVSGGGFAEYAIANQDLMAHKPSNVPFEQAAAVGVAALTAVQGLRDHGDLRPGHHVLINGASGGVGTFAVQLAKALGASKVTGVCSSRNAEMVKSIGADHVIDYTEERLQQHGQQYDLILDCIGNLRIPDYKRALTPRGRGIVIGFHTVGRMIAVMLSAPFISSKNGRRIANFTARANRADLQLFAELMEDGRVKTVIDRIYPFEELPQAILYNEEGHARGKVVVRVGQ